MDVEFLISHRPMGSILERCLFPFYTHTVLLNNELAESSLQEEALLQISTRSSEETIVQTLRATVSPIGWGQCESCEWVRGRYYVTVKQQCST